MMSLTALCSEPIALDSNLISTTVAAGIKAATMRNKIDATALSGVERNPNRKAQSQCGVFLYVSTDSPLSENLDNFQC